jgi:hypothetical protein
MGYTAIKKGNKVATFHDSVFYENDKTITGNVALLAKFDFLSENYLKINSKPITIEYKHSGFCGEDKKFEKEVLKSLENFEINDVHNFISCKTEKEILEKIVHILNNSNNPNSDFFLDNIQSGKRNAIFYMIVLADFF